MVRYIVGFLVVWLMVGVGAYALSRMEHKGQATTAKLVSRVILFALLLAFALALVFLV